MRGILVFLLLAGTGAVAFAETISTLCQASEVVFNGGMSERTLVGCGDGFSENLLWHLDRSDDARGVLDGRVTRTLTGRGAVIYFVDYYGILATHDEFARDSGTNVIAGIERDGGSCCTATRAQWQTADDILLYGHATGVASVAVGRITGVAPDASAVALLAPSREADFIITLRQIVRHAYAPTTPSFRTAIVNFSGHLNLRDPQTPEVDAMIRRMTTGVDEQGEADPNGKRFLFVLAAGNWSDYVPYDQCGPDKGVRMYPSSLAPEIDGVVSVGGIDRLNRYWSGSCRGAEVAGPAPDMFVASISSNRAYRYKPARLASGTSWATPYVSGIAALLLEQDRNRSPAELEALLEASPSRVESIPVPVMPGTLLPPAPKRRAARH